MESTLKITSKGQVTLRKDVLDHLGVRPGDAVVIEYGPPGRVEVRAAPKHQIDAIFGFLKDPGTPVRSIEEINEAIADGWAGKR